VYPHDLLILHNFLKDALKLLIQNLSHCGFETLCPPPSPPPDACRIQVEQLSAPETIVPEILKRCPAKQLMALYKVPAFKDSDDFLQHVAFQRGRLLPGGIGDSKSAARVVLHDWHNGKIAYYTMPPRRGDGTHEEAAIVQAWGEAFNAERVSLLCLAPSMCTSLPLT